MFFNNLLGHLRPEDPAIYLWDWYQKVTFPYFSELGGKESGWISNGWRLKADYEKSPLGTSGMLEIGYETPSFMVLQARADGWLQIRLAPPGSDDALVWVSLCHLREAPVKLVFERWEEVFRRKGSALFYRREIAHNLRSAPRIDAETVHVIPAEYRHYQLELLDIRGNWMKVKVIEPPSFCGGEDQPHQIYKGWIRWRDDRVGPWLYLCDAGMLTIADNMLRFSK